MLYEECDLVFVINCNDLFWECNVFLLRGVGEIKE